MKVIEKYNALDGRTVTREELQEIAKLGKEQEVLEIYERITAVLEANDYDTFEIKISKPLGLNAARHTGAAKTALDDCGRLKKGYKYQDGKIVKIQRKKKKAVTKRKPATKKGRKKTNSGAQKKSKENTEKEKLRKKVLGLKSLLKKTFR